MAELKHRSYSSRPNFGDSAPSNTIPFPKKANLTAVEILAFLPNTVNCADVVYRLISNGGKRRSIHAIVNAHRDLNVEWSANCCGEALYKTMHKAGYAEWTISRHNLWHDDREASWDNNTIDVSDLRPASNGPVETIPFIRLAENIRMMPQEDDALDLTRMVQYCVQNSEDGWRYPKDYEELLELLGGAAKVREENTDGAVFRRWESTKPPLPTPKPKELSDDVEFPPRCYKATRRRSAARNFSEDSGSRLLSPALDSLITTTDASGTIRTELEGALRLAVTNESEPHSTCSTPYVRRLAEYVSPPSSVIADPPSPLALVQAIHVEQAFDKPDSYDAYAFGGPRQTPPYRYLNQITQPNPWDISGWAENLRWAFEQQVLFARDFPEALRWNESPPHLACIERERIQYVWASDELLEQLVEIE